MPSRTTVDGVARDALPRGAVTPAPQTQRYSGISANVQIEPPAGTRPRA
jgi:hypothetical protein